ncbi:alpha/beta hydrolase [Actinospica durhamensis]|uniref:Alpha/beta hydrolase n=1 Tax=Actinospica durhamensis TaxID=1508375 RepID=A0A941ER41_9ACTN|nr:alpha/beta hydrolase [Actinospica durhamensis]MBR7836432.1 alpha/beta hydrolase [Actinospica durhamensis]
MSSQSMATVEVGKVSLSYRVAGPAEAPPMVLLHGLGQRAASWQAVADAFAESHRVFAPDLRGHGQSAWPGRYSLELMRDDVLGFVEALSLDHVVLVGHSAGGLVALLCAEQRPKRVERLVVEEAPVPIVGGQPEPLRPRLAGQPGFDWLAVESFVEQVNAPDPAWYDELRQISVPTLLVAGGPASRLSQERITQDAARIPHCTLVTIPAGHHVHRDRPTEFVTAVCAFLQG